MKALILAAGIAAAVTGMAVPALANDTVKIGVLSDFTGPYAAWGAEGSVLAAEMAVEDFTKTNPDFPYEIEVISADFGLKADNAVAIAQKWEAEGVNAIIDIPHSPSALAVNAVVRGSETALLISGSAHNDLTTTECSPNMVHWTYDQQSLTKPTAHVMSEGGKSWFFITVDAAGGVAVENSAREIIDAAGGETLGSIKTPPNNSDFSSALLMAQASQADIIAIAQGGSDTVNAVKQAQEFGIGQDGQKLVLLFVIITDIEAMGLATAQGLNFTEAFYWDSNDGTRDFSKRFAERYNGKVPTSVQAGAYSVVTHYLKGVQAASSTSGPVVIAKMKEIPVSDIAFGEGKLRVDGRMVHDHVLVEVKSPDKSTGPWDFYKIVRHIPGDEAFRPMSTECPLVK